MAAGPVGSTGFCEGQCCTGSCSYDTANKTYYCCKPLDNPIQQAGLPTSRILGSFSMENIYERFEGSD
jgi:hypothetical protein